MKKNGRRNSESDFTKNGKYKGEARKNISDITTMLRMFRGQKLIGSHFDSDYKTLYLDFEDFTFCVDLIGAKWSKRRDLRIFISPIIGHESWEEEEDFNMTFKKYKKGKEYD